MCFRRGQTILTCEEEIHALKVSLQSGLSKARAGTNLRGPFVRLQEFTDNKLMKKQSMMHIPKKALSPVP